MSIARKLSKLAKFFSYDSQVGIVQDFAGSAAPAGWLLCYGQAVSRTQYAALFAVIGTTFGAGDGATTFNVPDARGRVIAGKDNMGGGAAGRLTSGAGGVNGAALGGAGGGETHTLTTVQMPAHAHGVTDPGHKHVYAKPTVLVGSPSGSLNQVFGNSGTPTDTDWVGTGISIQNNGGGAAHPNVQPTLVLNKIIFAGA